MPSSSWYGMEHRNPDNVHTRRTARSPGSHPADGRNHALSLNLSKSKTSGVFVDFGHAGFLSLTVPKGPSTAHSRTPVPKTILGTVYLFEPEPLNGQYMNPLGCIFQD